MSELDDEIKKTQLSLDSTDKANLAHIAKLRKDKADGEAIEEAYGGWSAERQFDEEKLDNLLAQKLVSRANKLDVPLPATPTYSKDDPHWEESDRWRRSMLNGAFILTQQGRSHLDDAIWKTEERKYNRWSRWVTLGIGLFGTLTALLSVIANNWERFATMFSRISSVIRH